MSETWTISNDKIEGCPLCADGWPRLVNHRTNEALHSLPEPAGMWVCRSGIAHQKPNRLDEVVWVSRSPMHDNLTRRDILERLSEECAEVIQATQKCLLYGFDRDWPGYGVNWQKLQSEIWDVMALIDVLDMGKTDSQRTLAKLYKVSKWKHYMRTHSEHGPQLGELTGHAYTQRDHTAPTNTDQLDEFFRQTSGNHNDPSSRSGTDSETPDESS